MTPADFERLRYLLKPHGVIHLWAPETATFEYFHNQFSLCGLQGFWYALYNVTRNAFADPVPIRSVGVLKVLEVDRF
jgi:hypothetical protein